MMKANVNLESMGAEGQRHKVAHEENAFCPLYECEELAEHDLVDTSKVIMRFYCGDELFLEGLFEHVTQEMVDRGMHYVRRGGQLKQVSMEFHFTRSP